MNEAHRDQIDRYNALIRECEVFLSPARDIELQKETCARLYDFQSDLEKEKQKAVSAGDENFANLLLGFECVAECIRAEITMWILLKMGNPDEAWDSLISAQTAAADAARAHEGFSHLAQKSERLETIEQLVFPPQVFLSSGLIVRHQECSICGAEYGECGHLAGMPYWGTFCHIIAKDIEARHFAIVENPADKRCRITEFEADGGWRNRMTWKIDPRKPDTATDDSAPNSGGRMAKAHLMSLAHRRLK